MAPRVPRSKRAPMRRRPLVRRRRPVRRAPPATTEFASAKQTISLAQDQMNTVFRFDDVNLAQFDRMVAIAKCYQYFRMTKIEMKFQPLMDTFTDSTAQSVPYFYHLITKGDNLDAGTFNKLRDAGAKPIRFDEKTINVNWRPAVLRGVIGEDTTLPVNPSVIGWSEAKISPWLSTAFQPASQALTWTPSAVPHKGLLYGVEQQNSVETKYYSVSITAHFQFKKPATYATLGADIPSTPKRVIDREDP